MICSTSPRPLLEQPRLGLSPTHNLLQLLSARITHALTLQLGEAIALVLILIEPPQSVLHKLLTLQLMHLP